MSRIKENCGDALEVMGPFSAVVSKIKDIYRVVVYLRCNDEELLAKAMEAAQLLQDECKDSGKKEVTLQTDMDPVASF